MEEHARNRKENEKEMKTNKKEIRKRKRKCQVNWCTLENVDILFHGMNAIIL